MLFIVCPFSDKLRFLYGVVEKNMFNLSMPAESLDEIYSNNFLFHADDAVSL